MTLKPIQILLADDDKDDSLFFKMALDGLSVPTNLASVINGEELMSHLLENSNALPDVLFLDLNMPRKNGFECLSEIKQNQKLKLLPVIIISTSYEQEVVNQLYFNGAQYFIRKPAEFSQLKKIIQYTFGLITQGQIMQPSREGFVLIA